MTQLPRFPVPHKFWVSYRWLGLNYVAQINAPEEPPTRHFENYGELNAAMDELGHLWEMLCETPHPYEYAFDDVHVWEKQLAHVLAQEISPEPWKLHERRLFLPGFSR